MDPLIAQVAQTSIPGVEAFEALVRSVEATSSGLAQFNQDLEAVSSELQQLVRVIQTARSQLATPAAAPQSANDEENGRSFLGFVVGLLEEGFGQAVTTITQDFTARVTRDIQVPDISVFGLNIGERINNEIADIISNNVASALQEANVLSDDFSFLDLIGPGRLGSSFVLSEVGEFLGLSETRTNPLGFSITVARQFGGFLEDGLNDFSSPINTVGNAVATLALDAILGDRGIGSTIGQTLGSLGGSFIGGPVGGVVGGALGNIFGGLFGGNRRPPDSTAVFDLSFANDNFRLAGSKNPTSEQEQVLRALSQQVLGLEKLLNDLGGGFGSFGGVGFGLSGKYSDFVTIPGVGRIDTGTRNNIGAVEALLLEQLVPQISGLDATLMGVVSRSDASGFAALTQELSAAESFLEQYETLVDHATLSEEEFAIKQVTERWEQLIDQAKEYELALDPLIELRDKEVAAIEAQAAALDETERARNAVLLDTLAAGQAIQDFLDGQALSDASSLSPTARLAEVQAQFGDNLDLVRDGDLGAIGALTASAATLLRFGREQFASTLSFAALESSVRSSLASVGVDLTGEQAIEDRTADAVEAQTETLADQNERLIDEVIRMREELRSLKRSFEAQAA